MRRARPLAAGLAVVALALAGCSDDSGDSGGATTDGVDAGSGDVVEVPGVVTGADSLVFLPGALRVVAPCDGSLCVWSSSRGVLVDRWDGGGIVADAGPGVYTDRVQDGAVELVLLDETSGREVGSVEAHEVDDVQDGPSRGLRDIELSPDGRWVAAVGADGVVRRWAARGLDDEMTIDTGADAVAVAWSADASGSPSPPPTAPSRSAMPRPERTGRLDAPPQGDVVWSDDGTHLATASFSLDEEAATTVWDATTLEEVASLARPGDRLAFMGEDTLLLSEKDALDLQAWSWTTDGTTAFSGATDPPRAVLVALGGSRIYAASPRDGVLEWGIGGGDAPTVFEKPEE